MTSLPQPGRFEAILAASFGPANEDAKLHEAFKASPRGRFIAAIRQMEEISYAREACDLEGIYRRSLADDREPLNTEAVGAALTILNKVPGKDAGAAIDALAELLLQGQRVAV